MPIQVMAPWGPQTHPTATDWDVDRDRDLTLYDRPLLDPDSNAVYLYAAGSWLAVGHDTPPPPA